MYIKKKRMCLHCTCIHVYNILYTCIDYITCIIVFREVVCNIVSPRVIFPVIKKVYSEIRKHGKVSESNFPSVHLFLSLCQISLSIYHLHVYLSVYMYMYMYMCYPSIHLFIYLSIHPSIHSYSSIHPFIHPSIHPSSHPSIYLSILTLFFPG